MQKLYISLRLTGRNINANVATLPLNSPQGVDLGGGGSSSQRKMIGLAQVNIVRCL